MDESIAEFIKQKYNLLIGERTAEDIKINIGTAFIKDESKSYEVRGRDLVTGIPKTLVLGEEEVLEALSDVCSQIVKTIRNALESTPPELAADIVDRGIVLAKTIPRSTMSAASSGGVDSRAFRMVFTICEQTSLSASRTSSSPRTSVLGIPVTRSRPRTS